MALTLRDVPIGDIAAAIGDEIGSTSHVELELDCTVDGPEQRPTVVSNPTAGRTAHVDDCQWLTLDAKDVDHHDQQRTFNVVIFETTPTIDSRSAEPHDMLATAFETAGDECDHNQPTCSDCLANTALEALDAFYRGEAVR